MRIALSTWGFPTPHSKAVNGIAAYTATTAKYMARLGHDVSVITTHADGMPGSYTTDDGVRVFTASSGNLHWYLYKLSTASSSTITLMKFWEIARAVAAKLHTLSHSMPFDIVEVGPFALSLSPSILQLPKAKIVSTIHGCLELFQRVLGAKPKWADRVWYWRDRRAGRQAQCLIAPSRYIASFYLDEYRLQTQMLPLPVEIQKYDRVRNSEIKILAGGGNGYAKGADVLIAAMEQVLSTNHQVSLAVLFAEGCSEFQPLKQKFGCRVTLLPGLHPHELQKLYSEFAVFVSPSRFETFGMNVAEAMTAGMTCIVSDVPSHLELIKSGETGLSFSSGNADALAQVVSRVIQDGELSRLMGLRARDWARVALDPLALTRKRLALYQSLLEGSVVPQGDLRLGA